MDLLLWHTHMDEGASSEGRGNRNGVRDSINRFFPVSISAVRRWSWYWPAAMFLFQKHFLVALVGRSAVADKDAAVMLNPLTRRQAGSGKGDENVGRLLQAQLTDDEAVEGKSVGVAQGVDEPGWGEAEAAGDHLRGVQPGVGADEVAGDVFSFQAFPEERGVDALQMAAAKEFASELEVMKDAEGCLDNAHKSRVIGGGAARLCGGSRGFCEGS